MRNRAASGRTARKNASAQRQIAYSPMIGPEPRQLEPAGGQQDDQCEDEADGQERGCSTTRRW